MAVSRNRTRQLAHPTFVDARPQVIWEVWHCSVKLACETPLQRDTINENSSVRVTGVGMVVPEGFQSKKNPCEKKELVKKT